MNRYFDASFSSYISKHKVIVFPRGRSPGRSYWSSDRTRKSTVTWTLTDMKGVFKEITQAKARKIVKHIP